MKHFVTIIASKLIVKNVNKEMLRVGYPKLKSNNPEKVKINRKRNNSHSQAKIKTVLSSNIIICRDS